MTKEELIKMNLHELEVIHEQFTILRVYEGWIYEHFGKSVFVPEVTNVEANVTNHY